MKAAAKGDDLQLLAKKLQEHLCLSVPSGELFRVKCAVKNGKLMILTQHPQSVTADSEKIFILLEDILLSLPTPLEMEAQLFLRMAKHKLPYAKHFLIFREGALEDFGSKEGEIIYSPSSPLISTIGGENESFDPMAGAVDVSTYTKPRGTVLTKTILIGAALAGATLCGSAGFFLTQPCVMLQCREIQTAEELLGVSSQNKS
jgi:hypothetical protein